MFKLVKQILAVTICSMLAITSYAKDITIGASLLTKQHPFYVELNNAMQAQAKKDNVKLDISIANQDLNKQISDVEDFITKKVDVIIISPVDSKGVIAAIKKAKANKIPIFTIDVPAVNAKDVVSHVGTDNYQGGVLAGEYMAKLLDGKGEVGVIHYPTVQSVIDRVEGFKKGLAKTPDIKIVATQPGITRAEALTASQNIIQANPEVKGIFGFGDDAALAAAAAAKSAGKKDLKIIGFDGMQEARNAVDKDPNFVAVIQQYPDKMGSTVISVALDYLNGKKVEKAYPIVPGIYEKK